MRILICGINYAPEKIGIGKYTGEMAAWLATNGHHVRVVTAPPYYPEWYVAQGYSRLFYRRERLDGVDVFRCPIWVPARPSGFKRVLHLASFALSSLPVTLLHAFWRPDVVIVIEPPLMCAPVVWFTARLSGGQAWLHVQDFEVDAAFEMGMLPPGGLRKWVLMVERWLMRRFDRVSTISSIMLERLHGKGVAPGKAALFPNWVDMDQVYPAPDDGRLRRELNIPEGKFIALYSGNMGEKQGLELVLEAARLVEEDSRLHFVLCGDGASRARLQQSYASLSNVSWHPLQPVERLNELLNMADVHLLPQRADVADVVMPSKLTGMLASGRPVIATAQPGTQLEKVVSQCGIVTSPGQAEELMRAILLLAGDAELRAEYGRKARSHALENLDKRSILARFERELGLLTSMGIRRGA